MGKKLFLGADNIIFQNAKSLRNTQTAAEKLLWGGLSGSQLGCKFRRQHPLGLYIADFYTHQYKLVIEIDGSIHNLPEVLQNDFEKEGY